MTPKKPSTIGTGLRRRAAAKSRTAAAPASRWRQVLAVRNWLLAAIIAAIIGVAVPWVFPATIDWGRDLWSDQPITIEPAEVSELIAGVPVLATPGDMPKTDDLNAIADLARQAGGQPAGISGQRLTLRNHRSSPIVITGIEPVVEQSTKPLDGTLVRFFNQGASPTTVLDLDLDAPRPQPTEAEQSTNEPFFARKTIVLEPGETHLVHFRTVTERCHCTWRLNVTYRYHDRDATMLVPAATEPPFQMTAYAAHYRTVYHIDPNGLHTVDPKTYCAETTICHTPCGTVRTASTSAVVRIERGTTSCGEAMRITNRYYNDKSISHQGSGAFADVDGWSCGSTTVAEQQATGHLGSCKREQSTVSMDAR